MNTPEELRTLARLDYEEAVRQAAKQEYLTPEQRLLCSIAQSLLAQAPQAKKSRLPWKR